MNELNATILKIIAVLTASFALITFLDYEIYSDTTSKHSYPKRNDIGVRKLKDTLTLHSRMGENERIDVFHNVAPSVVFIDTLKEVQIGDKKEPQQKWKKNKDAGDSMKRLQMQWKKNQDRLKRQDIPDSFTSPQSSGTGFVWDAEGHIITNAHVVADASVVEVSLLTKKNVEGENAKLYPTSLLGRDPGIDEYNWRVVKAKVIGSDPGSDIAVIKIDAPQFDIHPVVRGDDNNVMIGADCLAIGNPYGLDHTLTRGIISAKGRVSHSDSGLPITGLIQTDAAMNPGNSGGPLLNAQGEVIGMNTFIMSASKSNAGIGFAIPITTISQISNILITKGKVERPNFGIIFDMVVQAGFGSIIPKGVLISDVVDTKKKHALVGTSMNLDGSVVLGDIIITVNGVDVHNDLDVYSVINHFKPGDEVTLEILRLDRVHGKQALIKKTVKVTV